MAAIPKNEENRALFGIFSALLFRRSNSDLAPSNLDICGTKSIFVARFVYIGLELVIDF